MFDDGSWGHEPWQREDYARKKLRGVIRQAITEDSEGNYRYETIDN